MVYGLAFAGNRLNLIPPNSHMLTGIFFVLIFVVIFGSGFIYQYFCPGCKKNIIKQGGEFCRHCGFDLSKELQEVEDLD